MAIFIEWQEEEQELINWRYIGNGECVPVFETNVITKSCRYSNDVTDEMIKRATEWIKTDRPNANVVIR